MFSKFKELFDFTPEPNHSDAKEDLHKELEQLKKENEKLRQNSHTRNGKPESPTSRRYHLEFFLYDLKNDTDTHYTEADIHRYPMMGFTIHYLDEDGRNNRPEWIPYLCDGLVKTFEVMKVVSHTVDEPDLYSFFVDLKRYPHVEVKKCVYLVFQQLCQWQNAGKDQISLRVHIGGDELYQDLLNGHMETETV